MILLLLLLLFAGPANILSVHSRRFAAFFAGSKFKFRTDNNNNNRGNSAVSSVQSQSQFGALLIYFNSFFISICPLPNWTRADCAASLQSEPLSSPLPLFPFLPILQLLLKHNMNMAIVEFSSVCLLRLSLLLQLLLLSLSPPLRCFCNCTGSEAATFCGSFLVTCSQRDNRLTHTHGQRQRLAHSLPFRVIHYFLGSGGKCFLFSHFHCISMENCSR